MHCSGVTGGFFCFSLFKTTKICFRCTKMEISYREKAFHTGKKFRNNDFALSEKFFCYAPGTLYTLLNPKKYPVFFFSLASYSPINTEAPPPLVYQVLFTCVPNPRNLKGGIRSPFDHCVNALGQLPYWPSHMEESYCTSGCGIIIQHDLPTYRYHVIHCMITYILA